MATVRQARQHQVQKINRYEQEWQRAADLLQQAQQHRVFQAESTLRSAAALAESLNPYGVLARGYAIVQRDSEVCTVDNLQPDQQIRLRGAGAEADCLVQSVQRIETQENNGL